MCLGWEWGEGYHRAGMLNWWPSGRMQPLCLFCAAQIGIFIMQEFNYLAYFLYFYLRLYLEKKFEHKKSCWTLLSHFQPIHFVKCGLLGDFWVLCDPFGSFCCFCGRGSLSSTFNARVFCRKVLHAGFL